MKLEVVILAAGQGTRMKSALPKVLHKLAGKPLLAHVVERSLQLGAESIHVVVGHGGEQVKATLTDYPINWVTQDQQLGTGHAVLQSLPFLDPNSRVLILYGDVPLTAHDTLRQLCDVSVTDQLALLTANLANPAGYGRILRSVQGDVQAIVEEKDASSEQKQITEINTGILAAPANKLAEWLPRLSDNNAQGEYYLTDTVAMAVTDGTGCVAMSAVNEYEIQGVNSRAQLVALERWLQAEVANELMAAGVTLADPSRLDVRGQLLCEPDVFIDVNAVIEGVVTLARDVSIGPNVYLKNCTIAEGTAVKANSVIEETAIGAYCDIGPFARLRPGSKLADHAKIGNFVEIKKANIGKGSKVNHLSYVGDAELGKDVNVGAGTITCNYDGANKHQTKLGDGVFVGSNTALVAPIDVGDNATIGAGSTLSNDVVSDVLTVERGRTRVIKDWQRPTKDKN